MARGSLDLVEGRDREVGVRQRPLPLRRVGMVVAELVPAGTGRVSLMEVIDAARAWCKAHLDDVLASRRRHELTDDSAALGTDQ